MLNRKQRRELQFHPFSETRRIYQPFHTPQGLEAEIQAAWYEYVYAIDDIKNISVAEIELLDTNWKDIAFSSLDIDDEYKGGI